MCHLVPAAIHTGKSLLNVVYQESWYYIARLFVDYHSLPVQNQIFKAMHQKN